MNEPTGRARTPCAPQNVPLSDSLASLCAAHGPVDPVARFPVGTIFGDWRLTAFIGRGGTGEVYCAEHVTLGTSAAVKVLVREEERAKSRFTREAKLLSSLKSTAFPRFYAYGEANGTAYLAMELLEPGDLPTGDKTIAHFLLKVCDAVAELHALGYVHRDIKPANILWRTGTTGVSPVAVPVLADLGLVTTLEGASETEPSFSIFHSQFSIPHGVGTPGYGAPEQLERGEVSFASDIHALGVLADQCFNGNPPRTWKRIIQRATSSIPAHRYPSITAFARAIRFRHATRYWLLACLLLCTGLVLWLENLPLSGRAVAPRPPQPENPSRSANTPDQPSTGSCLAVTAILDGHPANDVRYYLDSQQIQMPYRFTEKVKPYSLYNWLRAVVIRDNISYSAKMHSTRLDWTGTTNVTLTLRRDPDAGTPVRIWTTNGTSFDFVWCPPGDVEASCTDSSTQTNRTARRSVGHGYWIAVDEATDRQMMELGGKSMHDLQAGMRKSAIKYDEFSNLPSCVSGRDIYYLPHVQTRTVMGFRITPPDLLEWVRAAQLGGEWGDRRSPNALGMRNVFGNFSEWVYIPVARRPREPGKFMALGRATGDPKAEQETVSRLLCGVPVAIDTRDDERTGVRYVAASPFMHETNAVLFCSAQNLLRSASPTDVLHGETMLKESLESDDSVLASLARECCIERGLLSLEACGTNAPSTLCFAAIRNGNPQVLEKLAVTDPDVDIRKQAYERIQSPSQILSARFIMRLEAESTSLTGDELEKYLGIINAMTDRSALSLVAEHANLEFFQQAAKQRLSALEK